MGKTRDLQENERYQGNMTLHYITLHYKDGQDKGQKQYGPNRSRRD